AFSAYSLPKFIIFILGGQEAASFIHKFCALIAYILVILHTLWFVYYKFSMKHKFFEPQSIIFQLFDLQHLWENFLYFIGKRESPPKFHRYTYMQKLYYWSFFLGMNAMAATGLLHMYPEFFSRYLPGFIFNIAQIIHFWEAILAIVVKFIFHALMEHIRPAIFPVDKSIFTGKIEENTMKHEHMSEWKNLVDKQGTIPSEKA
ncbi:MAG TPA: cytochrome b/b6 domain-containing protein, partial [Desulfohalobiaceae bacterium]|nr:cytochrome b/b6 domain-containing protein [Desulfohalobiaceae bacterium]